VIDERLVTLARSVKGFMPEVEGLALHDAALDVGRLGPLLEIGSYCGKSAIFLGAAARESGTVLFTVDHHHGSEENQAGWEHHDPEVVDPRTNRMDTLPFLRHALADAELEDVVIPIVGQSKTVARHWSTGLALLFIDGGHALDVAMADYESWACFVVPGGLLAIHDVFEDPADGGQAPFEVWQRALADGFSPADVPGAAATTGSLRLLRR